MPRPFLTAEQKRDTIGAAESLKAHWEEIDLGFQAGGRQAVYLQSPVI